MAATHSLDLEKDSNQHAYIENASSPNLNITGDKTIEAWIKMESVVPSATAYDIFSKMSASAGYVFYIDAGQNIAYFAFGRSGGTSSSPVTSVPTGQWVHCAAAVTNTALNFYLNGELAYNVTGQTNTGESNSSYRAAIGADYAGTGNTLRYPFDGIVRNIRVWNVARTQQEIRDNMNIDTPTGTGLQGNWILNNAYTDSSGNGYTLTASGSPTFSTTYPDAINLTENNAFLAKHKISIDHTKVAGSSNLTDFPVVFTESNFLPAVFNNTNANGTDLRFSTDINGKTRLAHEVVSWDTVNKTGEVWVKINELDYDDNTNLYVHYKNATATALDENEAFGKHQVYPSAYKAVWHLSNTTESTLSSNDGTATSVTFNSSNGKIKEGGEFNGTTSVITHGITNLPTGSTARTMAAWVNLSAQPTTNSQMYILNYGTQTTNNASILIYSDVSGTKKLVFAGFANDGDVNATLSNSIWYHVLITYSSTTVTFYLNGSSIGTASISTLNTGTTGGAIGRPFWTTSSFFNGKIDNAFITNTALSADYIKTLYDNQNSPSTFARPVGAGGAFLLQFV